MQDTPSARIEDVDGTRRYCREGELSNSKAADNVNLNDPGIRWQTTRHQQLSTHPRRVKIYYHDNMAIVD